MWRVSDEPNSGAFYFNVNAFTPDGKRCCPVNFPEEHHARPPFRPCHNARVNAGALSAAPTANPRGIQQFTEGWRFIQSDPADAKSPDFDDAAWKSVTLPHDWAIAGPVDQNAPTRGAGFFPFRGGLVSQELHHAGGRGCSNAARRTFIAFDVVMANSDVYVNGELLGHRPYGYVSFVYELTPHLRPGKNVIAVRVDDSQQPASRWYSGAGINRQVRLVSRHSHLWSKVAAQN